jgi:hypothetical protein
MYGLRSWLCAFGLVAICLAAVPTSRFKAEQGVVSGESVPVSTAAVDLVADVSGGPRKLAPFAESLAILYGELADYSKVEAARPSLSSHFLSRAALALSGQPVPLAEPEAWPLDANTMAEARKARAALATALNGGMAERKPDQTAMAQTSFECWIAGMPTSGRMGSEHCRLRLLAEMAALVTTDPDRSSVAGFIIEAPVAQHLPPGPTLTQRGSGPLRSADLALPSTQDARGQPARRAAYRQARPIAVPPRAATITPALDPWSRLGWLNERDAHCNGGPNSTYCGRSSRASPDATVSRAAVATAARNGRNHRSSGAGARWDGSGGGG